MKRKILSLAFAMAGLFISQFSLFAAGTDTVNGLAITYIARNGESGIQVERLNNYSLGTSGTYIYNNSGSTTATAGSLPVGGYETKVAGINITVTDSGVVTVRPEYQIGTSSFWILGSTTAYTGTQTGRLVETSPCTNMRYGFIKTGTTTATVTFFEEYTRYIRK